MGYRFTFQREGGGSLIYGVNIVADKLKTAGSLREVYTTDIEIPKVPTIAYNHFITDTGYPFSAGTNSYNKGKWDALETNGVLSLIFTPLIFNTKKYDTTIPTQPKHLVMHKDNEKFTGTNGNYVIVKYNGDWNLDFFVYRKDGTLIKSFGGYQYGIGPGYAGFNFFAYENLEAFYNPNGKKYYITSTCTADNRGVTIEGAYYPKPNLAMDPFRLALITNPADPDRSNDPFGPDLTPNTPDGTGGNDNNRPDGEFDQNGEFNDTDDKIDDTQLPPDTASAVGTGFISLYTPTYAQLTSLATFLWSPGFADTISKLFANPFEVIMNLHSMPFTVPAGATQNIRCGNVDTKVVAPLVASQYFTFDFGTVKIPKYSGTYLDYSPYTSYKITLPYMTTYSLNTDEITGKTLGLKYHVDVATGDTVAVISVDGQDTYTFTGNIATNIPITQGDYTNFWTTLTKATFDTAQTAVAVGAGGASQATGGVGALSSAVETVMQQKPEIRTSGVLGSNFGNFGTLRPYITKIKPNLLIPKDQQTYTGFASYFVTSIGECKGYNQFTDIILNGFDYATDEEKAMIKSELEKGVIL